MALDNRDYFRERPGGGFGGGRDMAWRLLEVLNASIPLGTWIGIRVRLHITFVLLLIFRLISEGHPLWTLRWTGLLFGSVLLHEFGHCLACRKVGGEANDILMWPLGGLAFCAPPRRPWPEFVTVIWGPLVNVILGGAAWMILTVRPGEMPVSLNPFDPWVGYPGGGVWGLLADLFVVNYALLLFNLLLIFYPFDGGRLVQIALWTRVGYLRSLRIASSFGMAGAVAVALVGLAMSNFLLVLIAAFGFYACYQMRHQLIAGTVEPEAEPWQQSLREPSEARPGMVKRWRDRRAEAARSRTADAQRRRQEEVDRILDKVHAHGLESLTAAEKRVLKEASEER